MFETWRNAFKQPELRKKILYTLLILLIFRIGSYITVPFLDPVALQDLFKTGAGSGDFLSYLNIMTGGALSQATVFAMSITPYINASITVSYTHLPVTPWGKPTLGYKTRAKHHRSDKFIVKRRNAK